MNGRNWKVEKDGVLISDIKGHIIAKVNPTGIKALNVPKPQAKANACLIAVAPALLAACKDFVFLEKTNMTKKQVQLCIDRAKQAITEAEKK